MFNKDFYPTPNNVIEQILLGVDIQNKVILEPSAGKGNIIDYLYNNGAKELLSCEINNDLAKIVSTKSRFLKPDFLDVTSEEISHIDLIVMNPPFSADEKHILHAWDIAPEGCQIIALCNSETIKNTYTTNRQILSEAIKLNGRYDYLGDCFFDAERKTGVDVACVYLFKPKTGDNEFEGFFDLDEDIDEGVQGVAQYSYVRDIVGRYVQAVQMFDSVEMASSTINSIINPIYSQYSDKIVFGARCTGRDNQYTVVTREVFKKELQKSCWMRVFEDMKMDKYVTKGVRENINAFVEKQTQVPFTVKNIYKMVEIIVGTHESRMNQVLIEAFDLICSFSYENSTAGEKWKTNSDYMVNKKFIVPWMCEFDARFPSSNVGLKYSNNRDKIEDVVKALCFMIGANYDNIQRLYDFTRNTTNVKIETYKSYRDCNAEPMLWGQWYEWQPFFRIRGYKKGTMHFEFINEDVWMKFNIAVAKAKGWQLPKSRNTNQNKAKKQETVLA